MFILSFCQKLFKSNCSTYCAVHRDYTNKDDLNGLFDQFSVCVKLRMDPN